MTKMSEVHVTLSPELWNQFLHRSAATGVPLEWLVAGLVCDTLRVSGEDHRAPPIPTRSHRWNVRIDSDMSPSTPWFAESRPCRAAANPPAVD
jgi:hypothetical protein